MHIALFGATGRTGQMVLCQALAAGHTLTALVRDPAWAETEGRSLRVMSGSVQDPALVEQAVRGADAVISVLGSVENKPVYAISRATQFIVEGMQHNRVRRLLITSGAGVRDPQDAPGGFDRLMGALVQRTAFYVYDDMRRAVGVVRSSGLDWTIVRVPMLVDGTASGKLRVGYLGHGVGSRLRRGDLAAFIVSQLDDPKYVCMAPVVSN